MVGLVLPALAGSCILPDRGIRTQSDDDNPGAVRIVERTPVLDELVAICSSTEPVEDQLLSCPQVPPALPQGLIGGGPFCSCPGRDGNTLAEFSLYAEDPDRDDDEPTDTLYAVALLDLDPLTDSPQTSVAYPEHLTPGGPGEYIANLGTGPDGVPINPSIGRQDNGLWRFRFGKDRGEGVDLCNDDNGQTQPPGLHNLQIMVTDRPFFQPQRLDEDGNPQLDASGAPLLLNPQYGMPDLAIGATWAVANYVFSCEDPAEEPNCNCIEGAP